MLSCLVAVVTVVGVVAGVALVVVLVVFLLLASIDGSSVVETKVVSLKVFEVSMRSDGCGLHARINGCCRTLGFLQPISPLPHM